MWKKSQNYTKPANKVGCWCHGNEGQSETLHRHFSGGTKRVSCFQQGMGLDDHLATNTQNITKALQMLCRVYGELLHALIDERPAIEHRRAFVIFVVSFLSWDVLYWQLGFLSWMEQRGSVSAFEGSSPLPTVARLWKRRLESVFVLCGPKERVKTKPSIGNELKHRKWILIVFT